PHAVCFCRVMCGVPGGVYEGESYRVSCRCRVLDGESSASSARRQAFARCGEFAPAVRCPIRLVARCALSTLGADETGPRADKLSRLVLWTPTAIGAGAQSLRCRPGARPRPT